MRIGKIRIVLKSDLCIGSGFSYGGTIDQDVIYDKYGFPYIPAKRIKGCFREAAELIGMTEEQLQCIFGVRGADRAVECRFGNAVLPHAEEMGKILEHCNEEYRKVLTPQVILSQYSSVRPQTRIDTESGIVEEDTLRFTRVVNHYAPELDCRQYNRKYGKTVTAADKGTGVPSEMVPEGQYNHKDAKTDTATGKGVGVPSEMVFEGKIWYDDTIQIEEHGNKHGMEKVLEVLAQATRSIGMNRNRGLGSVQISFEADQTKDDADGEDSKQGDTLDSETDSYQRISYCVENTEPLMMSAESDETSSSIIAGSSVLGALAASYLRYPGKKADDPFFKEVFLSDGNAIFSDLTPAVRLQKKAVQVQSEESGQLSEQTEKTAENEDTDIIYKPAFPAPLYINQLKKSKVLVNLLCQPKEDADPETAKMNLIEKIGKSCEDKDLWRYSPVDGNQPKKLTDKYIAVLDGGYTVYEPKREIIYHHRTGISANGIKKAMEEQLYFFNVLEKGQYFAGEILVRKEYSEELYHLLGNARLHFGKSKNAQYGACRLIQKTIGSLRLAEDSVREEAAQKEEKILVTLLSDGVFLDEEGNYTVNRDQVIKRVMEALQAEKSKKDAFNPCRAFIKTKVLTGYMSVWNLQKEQIPAIAAGSAVELEVAAGWKMPMTGYIGERTMEGLGRIRVESVDHMSYVVEKKECSLPKLDLNEELNFIYLKTCNEIKLAQAINEMKMGKSHFSASAIGRLTLMLDESVRTYPDDSVKQFEDFRKRIQSIKREQTKEEAINLLKDIETIFRENDAGPKDEWETLKKTLVHQNRIAYAKAVLVKWKYAIKTSEK